MIGRMKVSWQLFKASCKMVKQHPKLLVFPLISFPIAMLMVAPFMVGLAVVVASVQSHVGGLNLYPHPFELWVSSWLTSNMVWLPASLLALAILACCVFLYWLSLFSQTALLSAVRAGFHGEEVAVKGAIREAWTLRRLLLQWALVSGAVQVSLHILRMGLDSLEKVPWVGKLVGHLLVSLMGLAWNLATFLVLPVVIYEGLTPREALKRSANLVKQRAGETVTGIVGLSVVGSLLWFLPFLLGMILIAAAAASASNHWMTDTQAWIIGGPGIAIFILSMLAWPCWAVLNSVINGIFRVGLYVYAVEGVVPEPYSKELLDRVWVVKK